MSDQNRTFKRLQLAGWRQFASVDVEFHPRLTVLTGVNGVGKSTLLNILARFVGVERPFLSVPRRNEQGGVTYWTGQLLSPEWWKSLLPFWSDKPKDQVGLLMYSDGTESPLSIPQKIRPTYQLKIDNQKNVFGIVIGSHRRLPTYRAIPNIPFEGLDPQRAYDSFRDISYVDYRGENSDESLIFRIKTAIAAWAVMGEGNSILQPDSRQKHAYDGFTDVLRKVLPASLGFLELSVRPPDIVMVTRTGDFLIDAASGGVVTLIELAALIYGCSLRSEVEGGQPFVTVIDEPENHLHPSLQRSLFTKLTSAFPQVQFIVATHSPFMVSSLKDSNVYVLRYESIEAASDETESSRVVSTRLDHVNRAGTASEILRDVLGVPITVPEWVEADLNSIVEKYQTQPITEALLGDLKEELKAAGLDDLFGEALAGLAKAHQ